MQKRSPLASTWRAIGHAVDQVRSTLSRYSSFEIARPIYSMNNAETFFREGYRKNPIAYRCIELLASSVSSAKLQAVQVKQGADGEEVELLPATDPLTLLVKQPSTELGTSRRFLRQFTRYLAGAGEVPLYKVRGKKTGLVVDLQILPPWSVGVKRGAKGITGYEYRVGNEKIPIAVEDLHFVKFDDPLNPDRGLAPLAAVAREIDTDNALTDYRMTFFQNVGVVAGVLTTEQKLTAPQRKEFADEWRENYAGKKKAGKTPVLSGGLSYQPIGGSPKDFDLGDTSGLGEARICLGLGTPPVLIGAKVGLDRSTFSNYESAYEAYGTLTVLPLIDFIAEELTAAIGDVKVGREVRFDLSKCAFAQESVNARHRRALEGLKAGAITINAYLKAIGEPEVEGGDVYLRPMGIAVTPADDAERGTAGAGTGEKSGSVAKSGGSGEADDAGAGSAADQDDLVAAITEARNRLRGVDQFSARAIELIEQGRQNSDGVAEVVRMIFRERDPEAAETEAVNYLAALDRNRDTRTIEVDPLKRAFTDDDAVLAAERKLIRKLEAIFDDQAEAVLARLEGAQSVEELVALSDAEFIDAAVEAARVAEVSSPIMVAIFDAAANAEAARIGGVDFDVANEAVVAFAREAPMKFAQTMTATTQDAIRNAIVEGAIDGLATDKIAERVSEAISNPVRAEMIARTETIRSANAGAMELYRQAGFERVRWLTAATEQCEFCDALNGSEWDVGGDLLGVGDTVTGSTTGSTFTVSNYGAIPYPPLHPRCRCAIEPV